jgi:ASCH domain.
MKAITILQPWASLIACGAKKIETRSWATKYRGPIAIHAGKGKPSIYDCRDKRIQTALHMSEVDILQNLKFGKVIAIANLINCQLVAKGTYNMPSGMYEAILEDGQQIGGNEIYFGDLSPDRYAWILDNVRRIDPVPAKGMQRIWEWNEEGFIWANQQTG